MIVTLAGGVGAARMLRALRHAYNDSELVAIVNVGDDEEILGLFVSPDLDTITYTLSEAIDVERGWGLANESWRALDSLRRYASSAGRDEMGWFSLGDQDIGTHLYRTTRMRQGASLTEITCEITTAWNLDVSIFPATNDRLSTHLITQDGEPLSFQEYFVKLRHDVPISEVLFRGSDIAQASKQVKSSIEEADGLLIAPSNPLISIQPILEIEPIGDMMKQRRDNVIAVSPIIGGEAIKGPAAQLMAELGFEPSVVGVAKMYEPYASTLIIDTIDAELADQVSAAGVTPIVTNTIMSEPGVNETLAQTIADFFA